MRYARFAFLIFTLAAVACGKKGPPLPPLVRLPVAPQAVTASRQDQSVRLRLTVPATNVDGVTPADISRVDVFGMTGPATLTAEDIVRRGTRVGSIEVNPPPDPDKPETAQDAPERKLLPGVDQGATASLSDALAASLPPTDFRSYVAVGINGRGRRGALSAPAIVPLVASPAPPAAPRVEYDATQVTLTWDASTADAPVLLHVYDVTSDETRLTDAAVSDGRFVESRVVFEAERCFAMRRLASMDGVPIESGLSPRVCVTPRDTFPPVAPTGLNAVPEAGAVSLIWNPVDAVDLAGYIVLRAIAPATTPTAVNTEPIADTTFRDTVPSGSRVTYAVQAVDKRGNRSPVSTTIEESVR